MTASGYSLFAYGNMINNKPRMDAFAEALRRSITPGCRVIDLGAGPGFFALLACKNGAGHVTAIEPDISIEIARRAAEDNGVSDRLAVVRDLSTKWQPDEQVDVVVSDIRGVLPLFEHHIATVRDVRARLLKPGGVLIPGVDRLYAALVECPAEYEPYQRPWLDNAYGVDLSAAHVHVANSWKRVYLAQEALLCDPQLFATIDYRTVEDANLRGALAFPTRRAGLAHGILMWFETELVPGVGYTNAPGAPELVYGQAFFPLERPVMLAEGTTASAEMSAHLVDGQYVWAWNFRGTAADGRAHSFRQSSFKASILAEDILAPRAASFRPPRRIEQEVDARCLTLFDGETDLATVAHRLREEFPAVFVDDRSTLDHVAGLSARYNKA